MRPRANRCRRRSTRLQPDPACESPPERLRDQCSYHDSRACPRVPHRYAHRSGRRVSRNTPGRRGSEKHAPPFRGRTDAPVHRVADHRPAMAIAEFRGGREPGGSVWRPVGRQPVRRPLLGRIVAVVALRAGWCNADLAVAWRDLGIDADLVAPATALRRVAPGDVVVNRLDVRGSLDGVEPGLDVVLALERSGARIVNPPRALVATHDKLATAGCLAARGVPQPRTIHVPSTASDLSDLALPVVLKPRFGSWGRD